MFKKAALTRNQWLNLKQRPTQFGDAKNEHGTTYAEISAEQDPVVKTVLETKKH
jgi:hypothetical protein